MNPLANPGLYTLKMGRGLIRRKGKIYSFLEREVRNCDLVLLYTRIILFFLWLLIGRYFWKALFWRGTVVLYILEHIYTNIQSSLFFQVSAINLPQTNLALLIRNSQVIGLRRNGD